MILSIEELKMKSHRNRFGKPEIRSVLVRVAVSAHASCMYGDINQAWLILFSQFV